MPSASRAGGGGAAPPGTSRSVWPLKPGPHEVACFDPYPEDPSEVRGPMLEVVDEDGVWVSPELGASCRLATAIAGTYPKGARGEEGAPVEVARRFLTKRGLRAGDVVERAGYPEAERPVARVVREGETIANVTYFPDGAGGWLVDSFAECADPAAFGDGEREGTTTENGE